MEFPLVDELKVGIASHYNSSKDVQCIYSCIILVSDGTLFISILCLAGMFPHCMYIAEDMLGVDVFEQMAHILNISVCQKDTSHAYMSTHSVSIMILLCVCWHALWVLNTQEYVLVNCHIIKSRHDGYIAMMTGPIIWSSCCHLYPFLSLWFVIIPPHVWYSLIFYISVYTLTRRLCCLLNWYPWY